MVRPSLVLMAAWGLALAACNRTMDPCGKGTQRQGDRCVAVGADAGRTDSMDLDANLDELDPADDADTLPALEAGAMDAAERALDGGEERGDASMAADADLSDASSEAAAPDAADATCYAQDRARWADFHLSDGLVDALLDCHGFQGACAPASCSADQCLRLHAGVTSCDPCVAAEAACVAKSCRQACGVAGNDDRCRACACASGCVAAFGSCAGAELPVCADCDGTTCVRASLLPPELIMVIVDGMML